MKNRVLVCASLMAALSGCASVPTVDQEIANEAKQFAAPAEGKAGIYVYRINSPVGGALKKDVYLNGDCVGETAPGVFFYREVAGNQEHTVSTESEFSPNDLALYTEQGKLYFVEQYIKMGLLVGGANVQLVEEKQGKEEVAKAKMAKEGTCTSV